MRYVTAHDDVWTANLGRGSEPRQRLASGPVIADGRVYTIDTLADVRAFDRTSAPRIAESILRRTESFVDGMTQRVRSESMRSAQTQLDRAREQAEAARAAVHEHHRGTGEASQIGLV